MEELRIKIPNELKREILMRNIDVSLLIKRLIKQIEEEGEMIDWSVKLQRASRKGRFDNLQKRGLI